MPSKQKQRNLDKRVTVRLREDQLKALRRLSGPPPFHDSESEVVRDALDKALKLRKPFARC